MIRLSFLGKENMERIKIDLEKNEVAISFNKKFYNEKFIDMALKDFSKTCGVEKDRDLILLRPKEKTDINIIGYEFYNYVLGLIKNS